MTDSTLSRMRRPSVPLHVEVADLIRNRILSGELKTGARIPALSQLSEELKLAKMTIRQAMDSLEAEGLIVRQPGRGTFVRDVSVRRPQFLRMEADFDQLFRMVEGLAVGVRKPPAHIGQDAEVGPDQVSLTRVHVLKKQPFCLAELRVRRDIYDLAPERFEHEIVIQVLRDIGVHVESARQRVRIAYADVEAAETLGVHINSALMHVKREFFDLEGTPIYSALLTYPGDVLGFEIEFKV